MYDKIKLFTGRANPKLAEEVANYLHVELGKIELKYFSDGEIYVYIPESVRGQDIFIIQPTIPPADYIMELFLMIDAFKRASANRIIAILPYYGYARQERKDKPRVPISAKMIANLLTVVGVHRIVTMDLHSQSIQGFFDIPVDHLYAMPILLYHITNVMRLDNLCILSPDVGSVGMGRAWGKKLNANLAIIDKRRPAPNVAEVMNIIGDVKGKNVLIVDDMVDTAGTITNAARAAKERGAKKVYATCTHGILSGNAIENIMNSPIEKFIITNTLPVYKLNLPDKFEVVSVANIIGEAIRRIYYYDSISDLFE